MYVIFTPLLKNETMYFWKRQKKKREKDFAAPEAKNGLLKLISEDTTEKINKRIYFNTRLKERGKKELG